MTWPTSVTCALKKSRPAFRSIPCTPAFVRWLGRQKRPEFHGTKHCHELPRPALGSIASMPTRAAGPVNPQSPLLPPDDAADGAERISAPAAPRLPDRLRQAIRLRHCLIRTEDAGQFQRVSSAPSAPRPRSPAPSTRVWAPGLATSSSRRGGRRRRLTTSCRRFRPCRRGIGPAARPGRRPRR